MSVKQHRLQRQIGNNKAKHEKKSVSDSGWFVLWPFAYPNVPDNYDSGGSGIDDFQRQNCATAPEWDQ